MSFSIFLIVLFVVTKKIKCTNTLPSLSYRYHIFIIGNDSTKIVHFIYYESISNIISTILSEHNKCVTDNIIKYYIKKLNDTFNVRHKNNMFYALNDSNDGIICMFMQTTY